MNFEKIIFVTKSDTSRGPLAAAIFSKQLGSYGIEAESKGLVVLFPEPMNAKTVAIAASKGIDLSNHSSVALKEEDFGKEVLVLVLDEVYKQTVYDEFKEAVNVYTLKEFINEQGSINDPYGGELADYGKMYDDLEQAISKLIIKIKYTE